MLMSVSEIADLTNLSKVSIYNKLKLKELKEYIVKIRGITYVLDEGLPLITDNFNLKENALNILNNTLKEDNEEIATTIENSDIREIKDQFKELNINYLNCLNEEIKLLKEQLNEKDRQIQELINLIKNNQIFLRKEQESKQLQLEEHFKEVDIKLINLKIKIYSNKEKNKSFFKSWFK